jgi:polar amino acid transport system substrate-binding protein
VKHLILLLMALSAQAGAINLNTEEYPPLNFSLDGGQSISGSSTDLMREVMKRSGLTGNFTLYPWQRAYNMALKDKDSCVFSTTRTEAREKLFKWVGPLSSSSWVLFARAGSPIRARTLEEARPYTIGSYQGDAKAVYLKENNFTVDEASNEEQNIRKLQAGRIELWATASDSGPWLAKKLNIEIRPVLTFNEVYLYAACNLAVPDADIAKMNDAIRSIKADGTYRRIMKAYD